MFSGGIHNLSSMLDSEHEMRTGQHTSLGDTTDFWRIRAETASQPDLERLFLRRDHALRQFIERQVVRAEE